MQVRPDRQEDSGRASRRCFPFRRERADRRFSDGEKRSEVVRRYLQQYDGGDCFFIKPVAVGSNAAVVEGFGASMEPFVMLDRLFQKTQGFEASIGVRLVTLPQCPAIAFLNRVRGDAARAPRIGATGPIKRGVRSIGSR